MSNYDFMRWPNNEGAGKNIERLNLEEKHPGSSARKILNEKDSYINYPAKGLAFTQMMGTPGEIRELQRIQAFRGKNNPDSKMFKDYRDSIIESFEELTPENSHIGDSFLENYSNNIDGIYSREKISSEEKSRLIKILRNAYSDYRNRVQEYSDNISDEEYNEEYDISRAKELRNQVERMKNGERFDNPLNTPGNIFVSNYLKQQAKAGKIKSIEDSQDALRTAWQIARSRHIIKNPSKRSTNLKIIVIGVLHLALVKLFFKMRSK